MMKILHVFNKRYKALFYLSGTYTLFLYLLVKPCKTEETLFLFTPIPQVSEQLKRRINYLMLGNDRTCGIRKALNMLHDIFLIRLLAFLYKKTPLYLVSNHYFLHFFDTVIGIEDGLLSYLDNTNPRIIPRTNVFKNLLFGPIYPDYGYSKKVGKIYLTGMCLIPDALAGRAEVIDIRRLWERKNAEEKQEIIDLFLPGGTDVLLSSGREVILMTQPFSEDGFITESEKISIYKALAIGYEEKKLIIKSHPRERTDYSVCFPDAMIINGFCPMVLLVLTGLKVKTAISFNSTASYRFGESVEKVELGKEAFERLRDHKDVQEILKLISQIKKI